MTGDDIRQVAERGGFSLRMVEKAARLLGVLDALNRHAFLQGKFALKGGTALHLFILDIDELDDPWILTSITQEQRRSRFRSRHNGAARRFSPRVAKGQKDSQEREIIKWRTGYTNAAGRPNDLLAVDVDFRRQ